MMAAAQRDDEFVAHLAPECRVLREAQVVESEGRRPQIRQGCMLAPQNETVAKVGFCP